MSFGYSEEEAKRKGKSSPAPVQAKEHDIGKKISMPGGVKSSMEKSFNADFSNVSMFESPSVSRQGFDAMAQGSSIGFAPGAFSTSGAGLGLLGHELSHVTAYARGETPNNGGGLLKSHSLESRADSEGVRAAMGGKVGGASRVTVPSGSASSAAPAQGGTKRGLFSHIFNTVNKATKEKMVKSAPIVRRAVAERGLTNTFIVKAEDLRAAEEEVDKSRGISTVGRTPPDQGKGGKKREVAEKVSEVIGDIADPLTAIGQGHGDSSDTMNGALGGGGALLGAVGGGVLIVKDICDVIVDPSLEGFYKLGMDTANTTLSTMNAALSIGAKTGATFAQEGGSFGLKAVPGLGITIAAIDLIDNARKAISSTMNRAAARSTMDKLIADSQAGGYDLSQPDKLSETLQKEQTQAKDNWDRKKKTIADAKQLHDTLDVGPGGFNGGFAAAQEKIKKAKEAQAKTQADLEDAQDLEGQWDDYVNQDRFRAMYRRYSMDVELSQKDYSGAAGLKNEMAGKRVSTFRTQHSESAEKFDNLTRAKQYREYRESENDKAKAAIADESRDYEKYVSLFAMLGEDIKGRNVSDAQAKYAGLITAAEAEAATLETLYKAKVEAYYGFTGTWDKLRGSNLRRKTSHIEGTEAGFNIASDICNITAGILDASGVAAAGGAVMSGIAFIVKVAGALTTKGMKHAMVRTNVHQELQAKSVYSQAAKDAAKVTTSYVPSYAGSYKDQRDKLDKLEPIVQDIIDEVYAENPAADLHATKKKTAADKGKKAHGKQTTQLYKRMIVFEMGGVKGYQAGLSDNIAVNRSTDLLKKAGAERVSGGSALQKPTITHLRSLRLMDKKNEKLPSLGDLSKAMGNQTVNYSSLVKPANAVYPKLEEWEKELGVADADKTTSAKLEEEKRATGFESQFTADDSRKKAYLANRFGARLVSRDSTLDRSKGLAEQLD